MGRIEGDGGTGMEMGRSGQVKLWGFFFLRGKLWGF
jgi:hypothetical protein